jgi:hypothetical protein
MGFREAEADNGRSPVRDELLLDAEGLKSRRPLWAALSNLFLDTELDDGDHDHIAAVLAESVYSIAECEEILFTELYPILIGNMRSVAGVWSGFDLVWLEGAILRRKRRSFVWPRWLQTGRWRIAADWTRIKELVASRRAASRPPS